MLMVCHHLDRSIPEDVAFAESVSSHSHSHSHSHPHPHAHSHSLLPLPSPFPVCPPLHSIPSSPSGHYITVGMLLDCVRVRAPFDAAPSCCFRPVFAHYPLSPPPFPLRLSCVSTKDEVRGISDSRATRQRIRATTIQAEDILHDIGAISIMSSDSQAMGRIGEVVARTWQTAAKMKVQRGGSLLKLWNVVKLDVVRCEMWLWCGSCTCLMACDAPNAATVGSGGSLAKAPEPRQQLDGPAQAVLVRRLPLAG